MLSMSEAAMRTGLSKSTIHRAIKSGKLSAERQEDGSYEIDPAELFRVYRPAQPEVTRPAGHHATPADTGEPSPGTDWDAVERHLRELLEIERRRGEELREERDAWRSQAERLALPAPLPALVPALSAEPKRAPRKGLSRLFGRRAA
jgi:excisionase family DNA binding protein